MDNMYLSPSKKQIMNKKRNFVGKRYLEYLSYIQRYKYFNLCYICK